MIFTIKMHWKWYSFYYKNALKVILLQECIRNYFYYKTALEMIVFIIRMLWKLF